MAHPRKDKIWRRGERGIGGGKPRRIKSLARRALGTLGTTYSKHRGSVGITSECEVEYMRME